MTATATTPKPQLRPNVRGIVGWLLVVAGLVATYSDGAIKSGWTILGFELVGVGVLLVAGALRRQVVRRSA